MQTKEELRRLCRQKRRLLTDNGKASGDIVKKLIALPQTEAADALFVFYPKEGEIDLLPLSDYAKKHGKKLCFPLCDDKNGSMRFCEVDKLDVLREGNFGIKEPPAYFEEVLPENAVIFLPALAADKSGYRLGYGKGYYDRYLTKYAALNPYTVVVVHRDMLFEEIPHDLFDVPCHMVICN